MKSALYGFLSFILITCLLLAAGCAGTSPLSPATQNTPSATSTVPAGTTAIMLTGVPDVRQAEYYSCGASSLQAVLSYYGINSYETDLRTMVNASPTHGTYSWDIVRAAKEMGFSAEWKENVTLNDLESALRQGTPVIIRAERIKASNDTWTTTWGVGHYMVVYGLDDQNVYLEDPYLLGSRLVMTRDDFVACWHSYDTEIPVPPDATKHYHEAVFIRGTPAAAQPEYTSPLVWRAIVRPVLAQPPVVEPASTTQ
jgi:predicted double-glycine peptidase